MRALQRTRAWGAVDAGVEAEPPGELVADTAEDALLVGGVHGPEKDVVNELRVAQPALEEDHDAVRVDVVARIDGALVAEVVRERLVGRHLVHVPHERVGADRELAERRYGRPGSRLPGSNSPHVSIRSVGSGAGAEPRRRRRSARAQTRRCSRRSPRCRYRRTPRSCRGDTRRCRLIEQRHAGCSHRRALRALPRLRRANTDASCCCAASTEPPLERSNGASCCCAAGCAFICKQSASVILAAHDSLDMWTHRQSTCGATPARGCTRLSLKELGG